MSQIQITIESYGAIERVLPQNLQWSCQMQSTVGSVLADIITAYPEAKQILERCACAIGEDIVPRQSILDNTTTVVLLPPVAGG